MPLHRISSPADSCTARSRRGKQLRLSVTASARPAHQRSTKVRIGRFPDPRHRETPDILVGASPTHRVTSPGGSTTPWPVPRSTARQERPPGTGSSPRRFADGPWDLSRDKQAQAAPAQSAYSQANVYLVNRAVSSEPLVAFPAL